MFSEMWSPRGCRNIAGVRTRCLNVVVFRDGISEDQDNEIHQHELRQIFKPFKTIEPKNPKYHPVLSIVVCWKRHHARFFQASSEHAEKTGNTHPGAVVDKGVTTVLDFDFYLRAHAGLQGSVKSTHYVVLYCESALSANGVQQGVHTASYLRTRATKAVSLVLPAYYADIVCKRAGYWIHDFLSANARDDDDAGSSTSAGAGRKTVSREQA